MVMDHQTVQSLTDYTSFIIPDGTFPCITNCIGICRGIMHDLDNIKDLHHTSLEAALLRAPDGYDCVDISLYRVSTRMFLSFTLIGLLISHLFHNQEAQLVLLLNEVTSTSESSGNARMMIIRAAGLPFVQISRSSSLKSWNFHELQVYISCNFMVIFVIVIDRNLC